MDTILALGAVVFFIYDRLAIAKRLEDVVNKLQDNVINLTVALGALTAEFHTYKSLKGGSRNG